MGNFIEACVGVLQAVVEQRGDNCVRVQTDFRHDLCHGQRVDNIGFAGLSQLILVLPVGVFVCFLNFFEVRRRRIALHSLHHRSIMFFSGFHSDSCL